VNISTEVVDAKKKCPQEYLISVPHPIPWLYKESLDDLETLRIAARMQENTAILRRYRSTFRLRLSPKCKIKAVEMLEISPQDAHARLQQGDAVLIDVREPDEFSLARVETARLIPMQSIPAELQRLDALADDATLLILCHHGVRSLQVASWLRAQGIENCFSVSGGIDRWSVEVDPSIPRY
jgi:rhodanese-related sulfurtransferase